MDLMKELKQDRSFDVDDTHSSYGQSRCNLCTRAPGYQNCQIMMNKYMYNKFSASQNYYYTKDINDILTGSRSAANVLHKDYITLDEDEQFL